MSEHAEIVRLMAEYNRLLEANAADPDEYYAELELETFQEDYPGIAQGLWDSEGNYIAPLRNENGWTP